MPVTADNMRRASRGAHRALVLAAAAALSSSTLADAQPLADADARVTVAACLDTISDSALTRVQVYLLATVSDSAHRVVLPGADILTDIVARSVRARLGADPATVPMGEPVVNWRDIDREIVVTVRRDGDFTWRVSDDHPMLRLGSLPSAADVLLMDALDAAHDAGERLPWPMGATGDSLQFRLELSHARPTQEGSVVPVALRVSIPLFSLAVPWRSSVSVTREPRIAYPDKLERAGVTGTIILEYVVGADGRVDGGSLRDVWNSPEPHPRGERGQVYRNFIGTVRRALPAARFEPARVGGCAVPQLVQQAFVFGIQDG